MSEKFKTISQEQEGILHTFLQWQYENDGQNYSYNDIKQDLAAFYEAHLYVNDSVDNIYIVTSFPDGHGNQVGDKLFKISEERYWNPRLEKPVGCAAGNIVKLKSLK